jgi:hypothetical protein
MPRASGRLYVPGPRSGPGREGFVLISTAVSILAVIGLLGLAIDVGRMYVVKSELQAYADQAAMAAAYALDGTSQGLTKASTAIQNVSGSPSQFNRWNFGTRSPANAQIGFSSSAAGPFTSSPSSAPGVRFAQVTVSESLPLYFLPALPSIGASSAVSATSVAGQLSKTSLGDGLSPFSPDAHNTSDPNFGFTAGQLYTLRWPPSGQGSRTWCGGDAGYSPVSSSDRGYVNVGQPNGNSGLTSALVDNNFFLPLPLSAGSSISMITGQNSASSAMATRFNQDTDITASTYSSYTGNGRRILIVPVNNGSASPVVIGFAAFFLPLNACGTRNTSACCGQYIGSALQFASHPAAAAAGGLYAVELVH